MRILIISGSERAIGRGCLGGLVPFPKLGGMPRASQPASGLQRMPVPQVGKNSLPQVVDPQVDAPQQVDATRRSETKWGELPPDGATGERFCKAFGFTMGDVPGDGWCAAPNCSPKMPGWLPERFVYLWGREGDSNSRPAAALWPCCSGLRGKRN